MKASQIITVIRNRIWNPDDPNTKNWEQYPCFLIDETVHELKTSRSNYRTVKRAFLDTLDGFKTFEGWGIQQKLFTNQDTPENRQIIQRRRLQWLDSIIENLEKRKL